MKHAAKSAPVQRHSPSASAGKGGAAIAPPSQGIDFVDRGLGVVQRVAGGLEYTEGLNTTLESYPGGAPPPGTAPIAAPTIGATNLGIYHVDPGDVTPAAPADPAIPTPPSWTGARRNTDHEVLNNAGRVKLTNDVQSAEWVVEGHGAPALTPAQQVTNFTQDIATLYTLRTQLATAVNTAQGIHPNDWIFIAPAATVDLGTPGPEGLFRYRPNPASSGKTQITVQYENVATMRRIAELNASKFLKGSKIQEGQDINQVTLNRSKGQYLKDLFGISSFSTAEGLLEQLVAGSDEVSAGGVVRLTEEEVGLVKLMVINDAMASAMTRHAAIIGQAQHKNIQRFFPKARRQTYVNAIANANLSARALKRLRAQITRDAAAMATLVWDRADPFALRTTETLGALTGNLVPGVAAPPGGPATAAAINVTLGNHALGQGTTRAQRRQIKNEVLGNQGALLATWITHAAKAYTDTTAGGRLHARNHRRLGNVIRSTAGYTPLAGAGTGAIYEFREREIDMADGNRAAVLDALTKLFNAA